jgi:hypothetical protein
MMIFKSSILLLLDQCLLQSLSPLLHKRSVLRFLKRLLKRLLSQVPQNNVESLSLLLEKSLQTHEG